jgi:hypothetical protein
MLVTATCRSLGCITPAESQGRKKKKESVRSPLHGGRSRRCRRDPQLDCRFLDAFQYMDTRERNFRF